MKKIGDYEIGKCVGSGGSANCYEAFHKSGRKVIIKIMQDVGQATMQQSECAIIKEIRDSKGTNTPYILYSEVLEDDGVQYAVIDTSGGKVLEDRLVHEGAKLKDYSTLSDVLNVTLRILEALEPIHNAGYIHGDIAPDNLFVTDLMQDNNESRRTILCIDFNSSFKLANAKKRTISYKKGYTAPELRSNSQISKIGFGSDLYSIAAILFEMLFGEKFILGHYQKLLQTGNLMESSYLEGQTEEVKLAINEILYQSLILRWTADEQKSPCQVFMNAIMNVENLILFPQRLLDTFSVADLFTVGRDELCNTVYHKLQKEKVLTVIQDIGGMGKSHFAKYYGQQFRSVYETILFIPCQKKLFDVIIDDSLVPISNFNISMVLTEANMDCDDVAVLNELYYKKKLEKLATLCNEKILLIFDGLNQQFDEHLNDICSLNCHKMITSRADFSASSHISSIALPAIKSEEDLEKLFYYHCPKLVRKKQTVVRKIIESVSSHILTVVLIAKSAQRANIDLDLLLENIGKVVKEYPKESIMFETAGNIKRQTVDEILGIVFDMSTLSESEKKILCHLSLFSDVGIERSVFSQWLGLTSQDDVNSLIDSGWITENAVQDSIALHQVIADVCIKKSQPNNENCSYMLSVMAGNLNDMYSCLLYENIRDVQNLYVSVAMKIKGYCPEIKMLKSKLLMSDNCEIFKTIGEDWIAYVKNCYGERDMELAYVYEICGVALDKIDYLKTAIAIHKSQNVERNDVLSCLYSSMAKLILQQNFWILNAEVKEAYAQALHYAQKADGCNTLELAKAYQNLGRVYYLDHWDCEQQCEFSKKALEIYIQNLGRYHSSVVLILSNLAFISHKQQKNSEEVISCYHEALEIALNIDGIDKSFVRALYNALYYTTKEGKQWQLSCRYLMLSYFVSHGWHTLTKDSLTVGKCLDKILDILNEQDCLEINLSDVVSRVDDLDIAKFQNFDYDLYKKVQNKLYLLAKKVRLGWGLTAKEIEAYVKIVFFYTIDIKQYYGCLYSKKAFKKLSDLLMMKYTNKEFRQLSRCIFAHTRELHLKSENDFCVLIPEENLPKEKLTEGYLWEFAETGKFYFVTKAMFEENSYPEYLKDIEPKPIILRYGFQNLSADVNSFAVDEEDED